MKNLLDIDVDKLQEGDIEILKKQLKELEKKVKENNKPKTITISSKTHNTIKRYCQLFNINIGDWAEKALLKEIESTNCVLMDDMTYEERQKSDMLEISNKFLSEQNSNQHLVKFTKPLISKELKYKGWSVIDGQSIYQYVGDDFTYFKLSNNLEDLGIKCKLVVKSEIVSSVCPKEEDQIVL